jgi:TolB-like protein/DNA-binding winged helix-turn-helix (wHTH) protein
MPDQSPIYRFGPYRLRPRTRELYKSGTKLRLRPQPFQILNLLVERSGDVVTRDELRELLWSAETFVDFQHGLNSSIRELRAVLNDSATEPRYIETLPRLGYRMIAPVDVAKPPLANQAVGTVQPTPAENQIVPKISPSLIPQTPILRRWPLLLGFALLLTAAATGYFRWPLSRARPQPPRAKFMLAVLPFDNLTGDSGQDYFSDGLTEEMITRLGNLDPQHLAVIARTSVMHYKNTQTSLGQIGRELGVQYVIEGSVRRDADKVRISAQLIQTKDQTHVWARQYDRELKGLLALQGEIAQEITGEIQLTLGEHQPVVAAQPAASPRNYEAYDLYLKGQYHFNKRTVPDLEKAITYFQQATDKDPNYARAYAGLADSYVLLAGYSMRSPTEFVPKGRVAALRALQIDESLPEAHAALALSVENYDWDWQTAEKEFRRAIELNPNYATAHQWYAEHLMWRGRFDEALQESDRARQLDPLALVIAADNGVILFYSRQYDRAIEKFHSVLELDPGFPRAGLLRFVYVEKGMFNQALADTYAHRPPVNSAWYWENLAFIYGRAGRKVEAGRALHELLLLNRRAPVDPFAIATAYIGLEDKDQALVWLERAYDQHSVELASLKVNPAYDFLRSDPRFQDLLRRVGLG